MSLTRLYLKLLVLFFFLMLVVPTSYQIPRGGLLMVLLGGALYYTLERGWCVNRAILWWSVTLVTAGLLFMLIGAMNAAPGAVRVGTVYVLWPLLYLFFIGLVREPETLVLLEKTIVVGVLGAALMGILLVASTIVGYGSAVSQFIESQDLSAGAYEGYFRYRLPNVATLVYGTGFMLTLLTVPKSYRWVRGGWILFSWATFVFMLIAIVLSGRRAAWLVALAVPPMTAGILVLARQKLRMRLWLTFFAIAVLAFIGLQVYLDVRLDAILAQLMNAFDFAAEDSASLRGEQVSALFNAWTGRPLMGHGLGAATSVIRDAEAPWAYEVSYLALLFHTGIIGMALYCGAVMWVYFTGISLVRRLPEAAGIILPLLVGMGGFLIANGTNPYLAKFDYLWVIFLPIVAINVYRMRLHRIQDPLPA